MQGLPIFVPMATSVMRQIRLLFSRTRRAWFGAPRASVHMDTHGGHVHVALLGTIVSVIGRLSLKMFALVFLFKRQPQGLYPHLVQLRGSIRLSLTAQVDFA